MARKHPIKYRELRRKLLALGFTENPSRGKGSHRVFSHPHFRCRPRFYPVTYHGENHDLSVSTVEGIRRAFDLTEEEIYG